MARRLVFVLHRRPELTREEFQRYWSLTHAPLVKSVADTLGITGYHQVHTVRDNPGYESQPFDGVAELWFDRAKATGSIVEQQNAGALLLEDEGQFIDLPASPIFLGDEKVISDGARDGLRMTTVVYRKPGTTRAEFRHHWGEVHGPIVVAHPEVFGGSRYVQVHAPDDAETYPAAIARNAPEPPDGLAEAFFSGVAKIDPAISGPVMAELGDDTTKFADASRLVSTYGRVDVII